MFVGEERAGEVWEDFTHNREEQVTIGEDGWAVFPVNGGSVSVWALPDEENTDPEETPASGEDAS
ncbi:Glucan 1,4-alpha-maltohexaosidase precursor [compost metagenome]